MIIISPARYSFVTDCRHLW